MNGAAVAIAWLEKRGQTVTLKEGGRVAVRGAEPLTPEIVTRLKPLKDDITKELLRRYIATEFPDEPLYDPAALQSRADQRNREAIAKGHTDRFCACGSLAARAWKIDGREKWVCHYCNEESQ